jgi:flagellar motor switch protein FliN/FliY
MQMQMQMPQGYNPYADMQYQNHGGMPAPMPYMMPPMQDVNVQPVQFAPFSPMMSGVVQPENIDLLMDVPLEVTVELGRTSKSIKEILDFAPGTIIELNRLAGEPIDVLVNGKFVAKGEVVVMEEAFGIRVTEITKQKQIN